MGDAEGGRRCLPDAVNPKEAEMNVGAAGRAIVIGVFLTGMVTTTAASAADEIRDGKWQFTTEMQMPTTAQPPTSGQAGLAGNTKMTRIACINRENPVPAATERDVQCKVDKMQRNGGTVTWAMTCTPPQGTPVRSDGVAHYAGATMEGTFTTHMIAPNGKPADNPGRISGRYVGACETR
jgi:hypothetical protein